MNPILDQARRKKFIKPEKTMLCRYVGEFYDLCEDAEVIYVK